MVFGAATGVAALSVMVAPQTAAAAAAAPVSSIYSATQNTCLDTSTTDPQHYFLDTYGHPCDGASSQAYAFQAVAGSPGGYTIVSQATGQCLRMYRQAIRQTPCTSGQPGPVWTIQPVGTSGNQYQIIVLNSAGGTTNDCVQVFPAPSGYPGPLFELKACSSDPSEILTIDATL